MCSETISVFNELFLSKHKQFQNILSQIKKKCPNWRETSSKLTPNNFTSDDDEKIIIGKNKNTKLQFKMLEGNERWSLKKTYKHIHTSDIYWIILHASTLTVGPSCSHSRSRLHTQWALWASLSKRRTVCVTKFVKML